MKTHLDHGRARQVAEKIANRYSDITDAPRLAVALQAPHVACAAVSTRTTAARLIELLKYEGVSSEQAPWNPSCLRTAGTAIGTVWPFHAGLFHVQEEASMVPPILLDPQPGERVLDLCAAPGNKTAQIAQRMNRTGTVVANDRSKGRLAAVAYYVDHLGLSNVVVTQADGTRYPEADNSYDRVLVDAPCSAEGGLRRHRGYAEFEDIQYRELVGTQRALLRQAIRLCRPGGRIVYSTCTFAPEENECVLDSILSESAGQVSVVPARLAGLNAAPGITFWQGRELSRELVGCLRLWPHESNTGGFFVAVLEKAGAADALLGRPPKGALPAGDSEWVTRTCKHYGLPLDCFQSLLTFKRGRYWRIASEGIGIPVGPKVIVVGQPAASSTAQIPRLATAGALRFGDAAKSHVTDIDRKTARSYASGAVLGSSSAVGYCLVRHAGVCIGTARNAAGQCVSLYPKGWRR